MRQNFNLRRKIFGDEAIGSASIQMVELIESFGGASCSACDCCY